jgi:hypothetical protein
MTRTVKLRLVPKESDEQIMFVTWLKKHGIRVSASANGGWRNLFEAMKLKRMGVSPGFPDIEIPFPSGPYHGLYIELKPIKGGRLSDAQQDWLNYLNKNGYYAVRANGYEEAKAVVIQYLSFSKSTA